jgi:beta-lactamase family protein
MRITFIGHASLLVEAGGITVLSDPWWRGPCFGAQWWTYPFPAVGAVEGRRIDYIYVSHGHHDHFHPGTLTTLARDARVLVSSHTGLAPSLRELGFEVVEIGDDESRTLTPGVECRIMETVGGDTLMTIADGREVCVNLNDALHAAPRDVQDRFLARLKKLFPSIDYVFCGYGVASHFPNCYDIPGKDREQTASLRQRHFNRQWARIVDELRPRYGFPFAADVVFLEHDLFWANEPTHNAERPTKVLREEFSSPVASLDIAPGFTIENGDVTAPVTRTRLSADALRAECAPQIERANRHGRTDEAVVDDLCALLRRSADLSRYYLGSYDGDYRMLIRFPESDCGIVIAKRKARIDVSAERVRANRADDAQYDLTYTTRPAYLKRALSEPYGNEILFVGSGGVIRYARRPVPGENLNRELIHLLTHRDSPVPSRYGRWPKALARAKMRVRGLIDRPGPDLYDLSAWTVFHP